jgi:hypothetical protein
MPNNHEAQNMLDITSITEMRTHTSRDGTTKEQNEIEKLEVPATAEQALFFIFYFLFFL